MLYCAAIQGVSWFLGWLCLKDYYSPQDIRESSDRPGPEMVERGHEPQGVMSVADQEIVGLSVIKTRLSEVTITITPERWHYSIVPRFSHFSDKVTFWSLVMAVLVGTL